MTEVSALRPRIRHPCRDRFVDGEIEITALGVHEQTGSVESGKMADVVLWNQDPFSVYAKPLQVYIDGVLRYEQNNPLLSPQSDFELGQLMGAAQ